LAFPANDPKIPPRSTYRVQLHAGFTFDDAVGVLDYLSSLGISHLYCSPYLQAAKGSTHGYDVVDHGRLNAELGGEPAHRRLVEALKARGLGQVLDIVPNHMAADACENRFWRDVLENGPSSRYARWFDIDWEAPDKTEATVLVPVLGDHYGRVLEAGELRIALDGGTFTVRYADDVLPLSPRSVDDLVATAAADARSEELAEIARSLGGLPHARRTDRRAVDERHARKEVLRDRLARLCKEDAAVRAALERAIDTLNRDPDALDALLRRQNFRLAFWRTASEDLDYRRFFNIESLVGLRMEDETVFDETHRLILQLVAEGAVDGLRIDHVDGLRDPAAYLQKLHDASGGVYVVVEKILEGSERLDESWPVAGTSGYDFLNQVNGLFVDAGNEAAFTALYRSFSGEEASYEEAVHAAKLRIMQKELAAEVDRLTRLLAEVCELHRRHRDHSRRDLATALRELIAAFPVYRTYVAAGRPPRAVDRDYVTTVVGRAGERRPDIDAELLRFIGELLLLEHAGERETEFAIRFQQLSAPVMAKGAEDTAFYRYHRLISLNEVGGDPGRFGHAPEDFDRFCAAAADRWPTAMLTLSTHDTKRSADVRARINLLSEMPDVWEGAVRRWASRNEHCRQGDFPDRNAEYLLYQTLVGAWPIEADRVVAFMKKASCEAKVHTSWTDPAADYDAALEGFVRGILGDSEFTEDLQAFVDANRIVELGRVSSLAQTTLLLTCPGIPDIYQGTEVWDFSLVDPDNRRPVDYARRRRLLEELRDGGPKAALSRSDDGGPKLWLTRMLFEHRRTAPELYKDRYEPLAVIGEKRRHAVAFRRAGLAVLVPRLVVGLGDDWDGTSVALPAGDWTNVLTGARFAGGETAVSELLREFPVAVLAAGAA
jgi:(1->4)-alpha-D-glucan 1-alpha-D-glucosylmutase